MFGRRPPALAESASEAVRGYESRIRELLVSCADHQRHDPEVFLWNARRALEAMCHLLLTVHGNSPSSASGGGKEDSLDSMIHRLKKERVLDREQAPRFELARSHTNLGVHIQQPHKEGYTAAVEDTAHVLPGLVEWLYEESIAKSHLGNLGDLPVQLIREGGRAGPSLKRAATEAESAKREVERTASALRRELEGASAALRAREARWWTWLWRVSYVATLAFAAGICMGAGGASWFRTGTGNGTAASAPLSVAVTETAPSAAEPAPAIPAETPPPAAPVAAAEVPPPPPPLPPSCPAGMVAIPAITGMRLGQPVGGRRNWPSAAREGLDPVDVQAFCLDAQPRSRASVEPEAYDTAGVSQCERFLLARDKPAERTCLDRDEAERICATTTPGGHLPTLVEWESAARAHAGDLALPTQEWAGERFPPAVLRRVDPAWDRGDGMWVGQLSPDRAPADPEASLLLAWNQQAPGNRKVERGFRCAAPFLDRH